MAIRRNPFISSLSPLRLLSNSCPDPQTSRAFARHFLSSPNPRAQIPFLRSILRNSRVSRAFASSSETGGGGGASACWNCGAAADSPGIFLVCGSCRSVQPVDHSVDYFKIFGLERVYDIKDDNLEGKYKDWQKKLHPDLVHTKSEKEKSFAGEQSSRVTDAYRTLGRPLSRALYLLQLEGVHIDEEKTLTDMDLLAEMMDIREAVEEASDSQALKQIESKIRMKLEASSEFFREAFKKRDYDAAIASTERMRYYERAIEEIVKKT
ncbi:iron-sulfur cluster co-chaperone protein HscB, mitochondrial [Asparagus officinalis]|uniref:iron-sulfur cluster co-chaperone protein HscB, mitochondrial n=1 Tax=Asparagus officinalis TaxID=4686 RepID=UPI00098E3343|nr:iron-sulfur cluster co-chaperone protein HscB, mitochondrial [Asparagus officinalis]